MNSLDATLQDSISGSVRTALAEDIGTGDLTASLVPAEQRARARVLARDAAIVCGRPWFDEVFRQLSAAISIEWLVDEGSYNEADTQVCILDGPARELLTGERTALNFLQTLSATATAAHEYAHAVQGTSATILDTRKTLPGLRLAQKYAVRTGGAANHRTGLYDGILIKENHIAAGGGIENTVATALALPGHVLVEVEVETLDEAAAAIEAGAHRLLLDNFTMNDIAAAVRLRDSTRRDVTLEASGGITLGNVRSVAELGVDFISVGSLTKDIKAVDLSMRFEWL